MNQYLQYKWTFKMSVLLVLLPAAVYFFSIKKTVDMWCEVEKNREQVKQLLTADTLSAGPEMKNDPSVWTKELFTTADRYGIAVKFYTPFQVKTDTGMDLHTTEAVFSGDFISLVKMIDSLEKIVEKKEDTGVGKIVSVEFRSVKGNTKESVKELEMSLIFQQICW